MLLSSFAITGNYLNGQTAFKQKIYSIAELNSTLPDTCLVHAYISFISVCPPCPPGMQCKPCIGDHLQLCDDLKNLNKTFRLFTNTPNEFKTRKSYTFKVKLHKGTNAEVYEAELIEVLKK